MASYYQRRNRAAQALGYASYSEQRAARSWVRQTGDMSKLKGGDRPGGKPPNQIIDTPAGPIIQTTPTGLGTAKMGRAIQALDSEQRVQFVVTDSEGNQRTLYRKGGIRATHVQADLDDGLDLADIVETADADLYGEGLGGGQYASIQVVPA